MVLMILSDNLNNESCAERNDEQRRSTAKDTKHADTSNGYSTMTSTARQLSRLHVGRCMQLLTRELVSYVAKVHAVCNVLTPFSSWTVYEDTHAKPC